MSQNINELLGASMSKVREMVDANTVVGTPIQLEEGITLIPISKISFGLASGGSDIPNKAANPAIWRRRRLRRKDHSGGNFWCCRAAACACFPLPNRRATPWSVWWNSFPC